MTVRLLLDSDPIVYRSGFAVEKTTYEIVYEFGPLLGQRHFLGSAELKAWQEANPEFQILDKRKRQDAEPVANALQVVSVSIDSIQHAVGKRFKTDVDTRAVLSGPGNYRKTIAKQRPYKGNRDDAHIPVHYQAIRNYLTEKVGARVIHGREADDECSIQGWSLWNEAEQKYVVASIDKDLDQIPGWHFDYMKHVFYFVTEDQANEQFWRQALSGDSGDNVPGCYKVGPAKAAEVIALLDSATDLERWDTIVGLYRNSQTKKGCPYADSDPAEVALETAQLVFMQREPGQLWMPPGTPFGTVAGDADD